MNDPSTLLDVFRAHLANADNKERHAVECCNEVWTYHELDVISTGLALELEASYGAHPTVAIVAENQPYTFALHLAVWKLSGIVAPMDHHTPPALLGPMLKQVAPTCVVIPAAEKGTQQSALDEGLRLLLFTPEDTTMTALYKRFLGIGVSVLSPRRYPAPDPASISLYLFTSSASDITNIKCVGLTHQTILAQARAMHDWDQRTYPTTSFQHLRVLGWAPFSHMLAVIDISCHFYLTAGCYIFGLVPSGYFAAGGQSQGGACDVTALLLQAIEKYHPESFAGVPWIFEGIMKAITSESDFIRREQLGRTLRNFKMVTLAGAPTSEECVKWARNQQIPLILGLGMTELGGALFHRVADEVDNGWPIEDSLITDAIFTLIDDDGNSHDSEGELYISSKLIAQGYLGHDSSAFTVAPDGLIAFKTGDRYRRVNNRLKWLGRKDDFIMLVSGEKVDPRVLEKSLDACPSIMRSCVVGNNFQRDSSHFLCALVELRPGTRLTSSSMEIPRAIGAINGALSPPLRITWSRVVILEDGQQIPINKKGQVWRKKVASMFAARITSLASDPTGTGSLHLPCQDAIKDAVLGIVADALRLPLDVLKLHADSSFAELGMDSAAAVLIVGNLNKRFELNLPRNACHTHVDLISLTTAISDRLAKKEASPTAQSRKDQLEPSNEVVIIGQAVRLPGDLSTPDAFWEALVDMREDLMTPIPPDRWDHASFYRKPDDPSGDACDITFQKAGFVEIMHFDNAFFGISGAEAISVSPAVRLVLETTFQALENANIPSSHLKGSDTGVFVAGGMDMGYSDLLFSALGFGAYTRFHGTGVANSTSCGRLSYLLDVHGPSISIDTACSGGMVAFDQAVQYLRTKQSETAIVCGVNTNTWPGGFGFLSAQKMTSPDSRCATFSSDANGYVPSEGAVALILKTREAALRDGDTILAVIKSTGTKHNGKSQGLVAPNAAGQAALQRSLIAAASLSPADIDFVETHGTGTSLGDLIEIEGLNDVFRDSHTPERPLVLGAAKACIGHTEVPAGLVGIVKAIKQISVGKVSGLNSLTGGRLNPEIDTDIVPLLIPSRSTDLRKRSESDAPYRGLVVAYGFAGTLSGTVLEAPTHNRLEDLRQPSWMIFSLSAKTPDALHQYLEVYLDFCANASEAEFRAICYTSCVGRELYRYRFTCVVKDLDGLVQRLRDRLGQKNGGALRVSNPRVILAFPGQGSQFYGMAGALAERFPDFRKILVDAASTASSLAEFDVLSLLLGGGQQTEEIDKSAVAQICIFVYQYSVCRFLQKLGVGGDGVIGNSLGEISAAVVGGTLSYQLGLQFVVARAKILAPVAARLAGMAAVGASESMISNCIHELKIADDVELAVFSSPDNHVVSGDLEAIGRLVSHVKKRGIRATLLNVDQGFHSHCIDNALPELSAWIENHSQDFGPLEIPIFSSVLGKQIARRERLPPRYWLDHARNPVHFYQAAAQIKEDKAFKNACIMDVGPTPTAWAALQSNSIPDTTLLTSSAKKGKDQELAFLSAIAALIEHGVDPDLLQLFGTEIPKTALPTYPFQRQRHYPTFIPSRSAHSALGAVVPRDHPPLVIDTSFFEVLDDHRIQGQVVLPGAAMVDTLARARPGQVLDIRFHRPLVMETPGRICTVNLDEGGAFAIHDGVQGDQICSGTISPRRSTSVPRIPTSGSEAAALTGAAVYAAFKDNVQFGPLFKNIVSFRSWDDYADGHITVEPSSDPEHDRTRALDACIHMFGVVPGNPSSDTGAFLPMGLEGYRMYVDALPTSFICRYRLPFVLERNNHIASTRFEVISHTGELLASCAKYSAAWIDLGVFSGPSVQASTSHSFKQVWVPKVRGEGADKTQPSSEIVFLGRGCNADWITIISGSVAKSLLVDLDDVVKWRRAGQTTWSAIAPGYSLFDDIAIESNSTLILDATCVDGAPESTSFSAFWQRVLWLMKALGRAKTRTFTLVVVSTTPGTSEAPPVLGPMIQGMLRVFRREVGLENAYGVELPADAPADIVADVLKAELVALRGALKDNTVSYRAGELDGGLVRFVPILRAIMAEGPPVRPSGTAVVVGMGSIGAALGPAMISAGFSTVVFIGRRPATDPGVAAQLTNFASDRLAYVQADVADLGGLRRTLQSIAAAHGPIRSILHTAAVVSDATIDSISVGAFARVLHPKVRGAYNLHVLAEELALDLDSFVLFSSVSVPLGNAGQVAYVAANAFLDALAAHRRSKGLPGVSLQLGPWESALVDALPSASPSDGALLRTMLHKEGIPLVLRALAASVPVQLIAALDTVVLSGIPALATDTLFSEVVASTAPRVHSTSTRSAADIAQIFVDIVRGVLELPDMAPLELNDSLTACGVDSIAFGQIRGRVLKQLGVEVPLVFLSDAFTLNDMVANVQESALKAA